MLKEELRQHFRSSCSEQEVTQWFDPLGITLVDKKHLEVRFPHHFFAQWFCEHIQDKFEAELYRYLGEGINITYLPNQQPRVAPAVLPSTQPVAKKIAAVAPFGREYTFDTFLFDDRNMFPVASARSMVQHAKDIRYNPFIICGPTGSGKTHLLRAIGNELSKIVDKKYIFFGTIDELETLVTQSTKTVSWRQIFSKYTHLLLDGLHRLGDLPNINDEFVWLFNTFYDQNKQMVFTCTDKLADLDISNAELRSRLESGLNVTLKSPTFNLLVQFVRRQCVEHNIQLSKEHIFTLGQRFRDFRHIQGMVNRLRAYRDITNKDIDDNKFEQVLNHTEARGGKPITAEHIITLCAKQFSLAPIELTGNKRHQDIVLARQVAMFLCRELMGSSYPTLGRVFGGKDHSTAMHAIKKIKKMIDTDNTTKQLVTKLKKECLSDAEEPIQHGLS